ncbi:nuclear valosin-containing protein-like [Electrophorus electricus]|uniref:nuclear valosin-containing protein-like n=1 Tax=Electrophorus electricus TaxID=8005 RepID=UPI0015CFA134|nr:nuclear valosin-containing protein-like [Electrophorus electricus]
MAAELQQQYRMDCGRRNRTAFRIQVEKVHGVICSESGLSALEEKHLAKRARHSQEDDCYYVQEMFDPVRVTHFSEGSSILEDTTDSDGDISEREIAEQEHVRL